MKAPSSSSVPAGSPSMSAHTAVGPRQLDVGDINLMGCGGWIRREASSALRALARRRPNPGRRLTGPWWRECSSPRRSDAQHSVDRPRTCQPGPQRIDAKPSPVRRVKDRKGHQGNAKPDPHHLLGLAHVIRSSRRSVHREAPRLRYLVVHRACQAPWGPRLWRAPRLFVGRERAHVRGTDPCSAGRSRRPGRSSHGAGVKGRTRRRRRSGSSRRAWRDRGLGPPPR